MNQEQIDTLIKDAQELHCYGDLNEVYDFIVELCDKYNLNNRGLGIQND